VYVSAHLFIIILKIFFFCKHKKNPKRFTSRVPSSLNVAVTDSDSNGRYDVISSGKDFENDYIIMKSEENTYDVLVFNKKI
jgi:hypothetical protein